MGASKPARVMGHGFLPHHSVTPGENAEQHGSLPRTEKQASGGPGGGNEPPVAARTQRHLRQDAARVNYLPPSRGALWLGLPPPLLGPSRGAHWLVLLPADHARRRRP